MKIHHFKKRAPRPNHVGWSRDGGRTTLELERPTLPEMSVEDPSEQEEAELASPEPPPKPAPAPAAKSREGSRNGEGRAPRKSRARRAAEAQEEEEEPPPGSVAERLNTSRRLVAESKLDEARAILERLVMLGVASGPVHTELGAIYMAQGSTERALERFEDALTLEPMDLFARVCRGEARLWRGDLRLAQEDLQRVLDVGTAGSPLVERAHQLLQQVNEQGERKRH